MYPDEQYRAFLLGLADERTETQVEETLLAGRIDQSHLQQIEEELIDDHLFGRLSGEQEIAFKSQFLATAERAQKLEFARALKRYASRYPMEVKRSGVFLPGRTLSSIAIQLRRWLAVPWILPAVATLGCFLLALLWLSGRNASLNDQLSQATSSNDEHQRVIESMLQEQRMRAIQAVAHAPVPDQQATLQPVVRLSPGLTRGLAVIPVLYLDAHATSANLVLELPFTPTGTLHEELQDSAGLTIWKQEFSVASGLSDHGTTSIVLPVGLLADGEYQLLAENNLRGREHSDAATYQFRVRKD